MIDERTEPCKVQEKKKNTRSETIGYPIQQSDQHQYSISHHSQDFEKRRGWTKKIEADRDEPQYAGTPQHDLQKALAPLLIREKFILRGWQRGGLAVHASSFVGSGMSSSIVALEASSRRPNSLTTV